MFADYFLTAGTVFGELYFLQAHKIVAGTVICEVWHLPPYFIVECIGIVFFGSCFVCICSIVFCVSRFVLVL